MKEHRLPHERRRSTRRIGRQVRISVKDRYGHLCQGTVLNLSEGALPSSSERWPRAALIEIQPTNGTLWISVTARHCTALVFGYVLGCAFQDPPTPEILQG